MENETLAESWLKRNRLWISLLAIIVFVGFIVTIAVWNFSDFGKTLVNVGLCDDAIVTANQNARVQEVLGDLQPIDNMAVIEGNTVFTNNDRHAEITVRVNGDKGHAKMDIVADKVSEKWTYKMINIRMKNPDETIEVLNFSSHQPPATSN